MNKEYAAGPYLGKQLIEMLGLPEGTRHFSINIPYDDVVTITCEYIPKFDQDEFKRFIDEYYLVKKDAKSEEG